MGNVKIILSSGSIPWMGLNEAIDFSKRLGYDGLEIVPTRIIVSEIERYIKLKGENNWTDFFINLSFIKSIHQSWRLDIGVDQKYGINIIWSLLFNLIRFTFFPSINKSQKLLEVISKQLHIPVVVHDISKRWTYHNKEFIGGILYEIIGKDIRKPKEIKQWLKGKNHKIVLDTRDDQSRLWAKANNFDDWKSLWQWIGLKNISGIQITLIGTKGIQRILGRKDNVLKEYLLWLCEHKWEGTITVEVNPLILYILKKGNLEEGLKDIFLFIREIIED